MGRIRFTGAGGMVSVEMSRTLDAHMRVVIDKANPRLLEQLETAAEAIYDNARRYWPVGDRTKYPKPRSEWRSRDLMHREIRFVGLNRLQAIVSNKADYARFIKAGNLRGSNPYFVLIKKFGENYVRRQLIPAMEGDLANLVKGR